MVKFLKIRTKLEVIFMIALMVLVTFSSAWAGIRVITSDTDTTTGVVMYNGAYDFVNGSAFELLSKIYVSNGNIYNASQMNVARAVWSLNGSFGVVYVPYGVSFSTLLQHGSLPTNVNFQCYNYSTLPTVNVTGAQPGFAWFDGATNSIRIKRNAGNWATIFTNATGSGGVLGDFAPNVTYITNSRGYKWTATGANIQLALNDLNASEGGTVWLPVGYFTVDNPIKMWNNTALVGSGAGLDYDLSNGTCIVGTALLSRALIIPAVDATYRLQYLSLGIGAGTGTTLETGSTVYIRRTGDNSYIGNCMFNGATTAGIYWNNGDGIGGGAGLIIEHCQFINTLSDGIHIWGGSDFWIRNCDTDAGITGDGIHLRQAGTCMITECFTYLAKNGIVIQDLGNMNGLTISNCNSHDNTNDGYLINGSRNVHLTGCQAFNNNCGYNITDSSLDSSQELAITGCSSFDNKRYGMRITGYGSTNLARNITISGCQITERVSGATAVQQCGISIYNNCANITITGNTISGHKFPINISTTAVKNLHILNNQGYLTFFDTANQTNTRNLQPGYAWFNSAANRLMIYRSSGTWASFYANTTSGSVGNYAPNVTFITNSRGYKFPVTNTGLQDAIWSLNTTDGGWVELPQCNISITTTIRIGNNTWLRGAGEASILYIPDNANITVIKNVFWVGITDIDNPRLGLIAFNHGLKFSDFTVLGNQYHQRKFDSGDQYYNLNKYIISLRYTNDTVIENVIFRNCLEACIWFLAGNGLTVTNCQAYNIGNNWSGWRAATGTESWTHGDFVWASMSENITIANCQAHNFHTAGVKFSEHPGTYGGETNASKYWTISNCVFDGGYSGIYAEGGSSGVISNCVIRNITLKEPYADMAPVGINIKRYCKNVSISNCYITKCGNPVGKNGTGIYFASINGSLTGNHINKIYGDGIYVCGRFSIVVGNIIREVEGTGIQALLSSTASITGLNSEIISENTIDDFNVNGINLSNSGTGLAKKCLGTIISHNLIQHSNFKVSNTHGVGIYISIVKNISILGNTISDVYTGIYSTGTNTTINDNFISGTTGSVTYTGGIVCGKNNNSISNNVIVDTAETGICLYYEDNIVIGNRITGISGATYGIQLGAGADATPNGWCKNSVISANKVYGFSTGIYEKPNYADYNVITSNNVRSCTTKISITGQNTIVRDNTGYITETYGTCTIVQGGTSVTINHNLSSRPSTVYVTPLGNTSCANGRSNYYFNYTTTALTIYVPGKLAYTCKYYWYAANTTGGPVKPG